jgi:hypothetical protein
MCGREKQLLAISGVDFYEKARLFDGVITVANHILAVRLPQNAQLWLQSMPPSPSIVYLHQCLAESNNGASRL